MIAVRFAVVSVLSSLLALGVGCGSSVDDGSGGSGAGGNNQGGAGATGGNGVGGQGVGGQGVGGCGPDDAGPNETINSTPDPLAGVFTMEQALEGLPPGDGPLRAIIRTELGDFTCTLEDSLVPNGVANFVGLARGRRPWKQAAGVWVKRRYYDGLTFHRIIDDFMAQGGDPKGTGAGGPGYKFADEISSLVHQPGTLAYANSGPNTNGSQFYITEVATDWLDGGYTIFGQCEPMTTIETLTATPTDANDKPLEAVHTLSVDITRCPL